jgi:hypothetical protein
VLAIIDVHTRFLMLKVISNVTSATIANTIIEDFCFRFQFPLAILLDSASYNKSFELTTILESYGIRLQYCSISFLQSSRIERAVSEILKLVSAYCEENTCSWTQYIHRIAHDINNTKNKSTGLAPVEAYLGIPAKRLIDRMIYPVSIPALEKDRQIILRQTRQMAEKIKKSEISSKKYYDQKHRDFPFYLGQKVSYYCPGTANASWNVKFDQNQFTYPWEIIEILQNGVNCKIRWAGEPVTDHRRKESREFLPVHIQHLKPYYSRELTGKETKN